MHDLTELAARVGCELLSPPVHGGSASVYRARCHRQDVLVALKLLHPGGDPQRLRGEACTLAKLDHPGIARRVRSGSVDGVPYLMTAWVDGVTLSHRFGSRCGDAAPALPLERVLGLLGSLVDALAHAHARGVVHGDLSPANVLITPQERVVLIDFAGAQEAGDVTRTAREDLAGTPRYLAPELIRGAAAGPLGDQYAAALLGYELLTGHWPFTPQTPSAAAVLHHQLHTEPCPISELRPDLPIGIDAVFARALAKHPQDRYPDPAAFRQALVHGAAQPVAAAWIVRPASATPAPMLTEGGGPSPTTLPGRSPGVSARRLGALCLCAVGLVPSADWLASASLSGIAGSVGPSASALVGVGLHNPCNRYPNPGFDAALQPNFYRDPDNPDAASRSDSRSGEGSPVLQLGRVDVYGLYGVIVAVEAGQRYALGASLSFEGYVHRAEFQVVWLDERWQTIEDATAVLVIDDTWTGRRTLSSVMAPDGARFAVPTIYKDASAGTLYADDVVFAQVVDACQDRAARAGAKA